MSKLGASVKSMRLRTLPLSLSGILMGVFLAAADYKVNYLTVVFLILTAICLQILSNLSNELGDTLRGTDNADKRQGMHYSLMDGGLTIPDMKKLIGLFIVLSCIMGLLMIRFSFGTLLSLEAILFVLLGGAAINAARSYTLGRNPYGYNAMGDVYVFIFFGIITVLGGYFLCAHEIPAWKLLLPAISIGCFSVAVLNVNNIRDMKTDALTRETVAIKLGEKNAKIYQSALIVIGWICMLVFCSLKIFDIWHYLFVLTMPLFILHIKGVWARTDKDLDPMLPLLVMSTFAFSILSGIGFLAFLLQ
ncbi:MAG: 1,4-dihydroxy-2-naphthoate octaprenyltransferase [Bacteroidales bacterium]|nr:1,4-dihydroxy-2-naphthoate octaprenyltransferase [Bacteroidales bacterium]